MCNYDLMLGLFYNLIWVGKANIAFVEGVFEKCSVIITWQQTLLFSPDLKWICLEKDKSPLNSNPLYVFKNNSLTFDQINFCTTSKL